MNKRIFFVFGICLWLTACANVNAKSKVKWSYGTGTNIDSICTTKATFYLNGEVIFSYPGGGCNAGAVHEDIINKNYYWAGGGGLPVDGVPLPDRASIEIVSFHDRKRYRISVDLPDDLSQRMRQRYQVGKRTDQRDWLYFGLAPGGYYEVLLFGDINGVTPDEVLKRGIAEAVTDNWYDKKFPIGVSQYTVTLQEFDKEYAELFKRHPVPSGMEWAPIMDAYRAKQPKTDHHPIH